MDILKQARSFTFCYSTATKGNQFAIQDPRVPHPKEREDFYSDRHSANEGNFVGNHLPPPQQYLPSRPEYPEHSSTQW